MVLSGVFLDEPHTQSRADIVVVGDNLKRTAIESAIRSIEKQIGRELTYSVLTTKDFKYRVDMRDKFIRDVLDFPHKKIINKLGA